MLMYSANTDLSHKDLLNQIFVDRIEKDPKDKKDNPDDAPESGDKLPD